MLNEDMLQGIDVVIYDMMKARRVMNDTLLI